MKFRHFEFRLFPKLRSKKKKRQGKLCNYDFPRDIGLDKNCNYSANSSYDNYGADTKLADTTNNDFVYHRMNSFATCYERLGRNELLNSTCETPLPEIRINVDTLCRCSQCEYNYTQSKGEYGPNSEIYSAHAHNKSPVWKELGEDFGTPNTLPKIRTRIKTNPWLPSPKTTPIPTPTDISSSFLDCREDVPSLYSLPLSTSKRPKSFTNIAYAPPSLSGVNHMDEATPLILTCSQPSLNAGFRSKMKRSHHLDLRLLDDKQVIDKMFKSPKLFNYETDVSNSPSPTRKIPYKPDMCSFSFDFSYENAVDDLLETATIPRDDTFESLSDEVGLTTKSSKDDFKDMSKHNLNKCQRYNKTESMNIKQFASEENITWSPDYKLDVTFDDTVTNNMQTSIDTGYASECKESDSECMSTRDDLDTTNDHTSDIDLEWDNEPTTQILILDSPVTAIPAALMPINFSKPFAVQTELFDSMSKCLCGPELQHSNRADVILRTATTRTRASKQVRRRSKSLADLDLSLEEKVTLLKEEKVFVQKKIQESMNEDHRKGDDDRFENKLIVRPKQEKENNVLKTLRDLKMRLENQSVRLQTSYRTILSLKNKYKNNENINNA